MNKSITSKYSFPTKVPKAFTISKIEKENYRTTTFYFKETLPSKPGQFAMIWLPSVDEKPMSINSGDPFSISFAAVGLFSKALSQLRVGNKVGVSGPYGTNYELNGKEKHILLVGGGYGVVPLRFLAQEAKKMGVKCTAIIAAKNEKDLLFEQRFRKEGCVVEISTDDASKGFKGNAVQLAEQLISRQKFDAIYTCGPEKMMFYLSKLAEKHKIPCQVSIERFMKCGIGICGACTVGGLMCCRDGTIVDSKKLDGIEDWGDFHRDKRGRKVEW